MVRRHAEGPAGLPTRQCDHRPGWRVPRHPGPTPREGVIAGNLVRNGDAEQGPGGTDTPTPSVRGWTVTEGAPALIAYDFGKGLPGREDPGPPNRGNRYFAGGTAPRTTLLQDVGLPAGGATGRAAVDAGRVRFRAVAWLGGFGEQEDGARLSVEFRNAAGTPVALAVLGPVTATERNNRTGTFERTAEAAVPPGARTARLVLALTRDGGSTNDGYADALSLTLHASTATTGPGGAA